METYIRDCINIRYMSGNARTFKSSDGDTYQALDTGSSVTFNYIDLGDFTNIGSVGGFDTYHIYLSVKS